MIPPATNSGNLVERDALVRWSGSLEARFDRWLAAKRAAQSERNRVKGYKSALARTRQPIQPREPIQPTAPSGGGEAGQLPTAAVQSCVQPRADSAARFVRLDRFSRARACAIESPGLNREIALTHHQSSDVAAVAGDEAEVRRVHREWQRATGRDGSYGLTAKRRAAIAQALGWFGVADVVDAVRGCRHDTWRASKPRHFTEPMLLLKDPEAVVKFRDMERDHRAEQARKACELAAPEQRRSQLPQPEGPPMTDEQIRAVFDEVRQRCGMRRRAA